MNGELAQLISVATHGTDWLRNKTGPPPLEETNSTFKYVRTVYFQTDTAIGSRAPGRGLAKSFEDFRRSGVDRLWLEIPEIRALTGPANGPA